MKTRRTCRLRRTRTTSDPERFATLSLLSKIPFLRISVWSSFHPLNKPTPVDPDTQTHPHTHSIHTDPQLCLEEPHPAVWLYPFCPYCVVALLSLWLIVSRFLFLVPLYLWFFCSVRLGREVSLNWHAACWHFHTSSTSSHNYRTQIHTSLLLFAVALVPCYFQRWVSIWLRVFCRCPYCVCMRFTLGIACARSRCL